ncbi:MAG: hypothetical protein ACK5XN_38065 [Bacteroidota bacterium]|jgi:hypothetical protein
MNDPGIRLLSPDNRRVTCPIASLDRLKSEGWRVDPFPDRRSEHLSTLLAMNRGGSALCVANGPSASDLCPDFVSVWVRRNDPLIITCNAAWKCDSIKLVRNVHYHVVLDEPFWQQFRDEIKGYVRSKNAVLCLAFDPEHEDIDYMPAAVAMHATADANPPYTPGIGFHGESSGCFGAQMAMWAGVDSIALLGHDLTTIGGRTHAWGVRYQDEKHRNYPQGQMMLAGYSHAYKQARELGIDMLNLSIDSKVPDIRKGDPYDLLNEMPLRSITKTRTRRK